MAGNTAEIDSLVDPIAIKQIVDLKTESAGLRTEMVQLLEVAVKLNATLGGSTPANFAKNVQASTDATSKLIDNSNKQVEAMNKKAAAEEQAYNKYLQLLSKQQAERDKADAKEIAAAEKKAAKLAAIQAESARKAAVQFPAGSSQPYNPVTEDTGTVRSPYIDQPLSEEHNKSAGAIQAENIALAEQTEVLASLSAAQRASLELMLALQVERAENAVELKELNVQDATNGERLVFLTQRQIELGIAIKETNLALTQQTRQMLAADTSMKKLDASVLLLRNSYEQLTVVERESVEGQKMLAELNALDGANKKLALSTGNTSKQIGDYEKAQGKASTATVLADKVSAQFLRSLIRMGVQFAIITVAFGAIEWLYKYIAALNIFNPIATEAEQRQRGLVEAFSSSQYTTAIENVEKLQVNLDLASKGMADSDTVINEYNSTLGKTVGFVDTLNQAQKGFVDFAPTYIDMITKEAAAQLILADNAKLAAETEVKNQELRERIELTRQGKEKLLWFTISPVLNQKIFRDQRQKEDEVEIANNNKRLALAQKNGNAAAEALLKERNEAQKKLGIKPGSETGGKDSADPIAILRNSISNDALERQKLQAQKLMNDEKQSYSTRIKATHDFYEASYKIANNNEKLATDGIKLSELQKTKIVQDFNNNVIQLQNTRDETLKGLRDKQYKQDQEILKNNLTKQLDIVKGVLKDPNISYETKLVALSIYNKRSKAIIDQNYDEQIKEAGKNNESKIIAAQNYDKEILELDSDTTKRKDELAKQELEKHKKQLEALITADKEHQQEQLEDLDQGAIIAAQSLQDKRDDALNSKLADFEKGKISEKKYNSDILAINDQYAVDGLNQELLVQKTILAIQEGTRDSELAEAKTRNATPEEFAKITSDSNKGISGTNNKIASITGQLKNATFKQGSDKAKSDYVDPDKSKKAAEQLLEDTKQVVDETQTLIDKGYENQVNKLERIGKLIEENANIEKAAVDRSLDTQANKARRIADIEAQTASQQKANQERINQEKTKEARGDKVASLAKIIANTAVAAIKAPAELGPVLGLLAVPLVLALGAAQLALAAAAPIPSFFRGTGIGVHKGGLARVGELGSERIDEPGKPPYYSPGTATIMNLPYGTRVTPHELLPKTPAWTITRSDNSDVVAAVNENTRAVKNVKTGGDTRASGWLREVRQSSAWDSYAQNHFR